MQETAMALNVDVDDDDDDDDGDELQINTKSSQHASDHCVLLLIGAPLVHSVQTGFELCVCCACAYWPRRRGERATGGILAAHATAHCCSPLGMQSGSAEDAD